MSGLRRRELLGGAALLGAAGLIGVGRLTGGRRADVAVFDGGRAESLAFSRTSGAARRIDLRREATTNWRGLRQIGRGKTVAGLTSWADYVSLRGCLEGQGLRLVSETLVRRAGLVAWTMG